jgi:hypothetical protein
VGGGVGEMRKMFTITYLPLILCLILLSCNSKPGSVGKENPSDTANGLYMVRYSEPDSVKNTSKEAYLQNFAKLLGLTEIRYGYAGNIIRIWLWDDSIKYVIDISEAVTKDCSVTAFTAKEIDSVYYIVVTNQWKHLVPTSGWESFFERLTRYNIITMKKGNESEKQKSHLTHGWYMQFEIAGHKEYRYYEFLYPWFYRYVDKGSRDVHEFLKYFSRDMPVKVYDPEDELYVEP